MRKSSSSKQFSSIRQTGKPILHSHQIRFIVQEYIAVTPPHKLSSYSGSSITTIGTLPSPAAVSEKKPSKAREVIDFVDVPALSKKTPTVQGSSNLIVLAYYIHHQLQPGNLRPNPNPIMYPRNLSERRDSAIIQPKYCHTATRLRFPKL